MEEIEIDGQHDVLRVIGARRGLVGKEYILTAEKNK